jgi:NAD(P)H-hydrate repair Nnr-like enzyme with NAD(P)H-hydrate dehydratase domain
MIGGLMGQRFDILRSVLAAVFLLGLAGDRVVQEKGEKCLFAIDHVENIPDVLLRPSKTNAFLNPLDPSFKAI